MSIKPDSGKIIYTLQSNDHVINVRENRHYRWIEFGDLAIQSAIFLRQPDTMVLPYMAPLLTGMELFAEQNQSLCLLGLGGGCIVRYLREQYPKSRLDVIELNQDVIRIAKEYFFLPKNDEYYRVIHAEAFEYLKHTKDKYDILISDIYCTQSLPEVLKTPEFYRVCKSRLSSKGIFVINLVVDDQQELIQVLCEIKKSFGKNTLTIPIKHYHNQIVIGTLDEDIFQRLERLKNSGEIKNVQYDFEVGYFIDELEQSYESRLSLLERLFK